MSRVGGTVMSARLRQTAAALLLLLALPAALAQDDPAQGSPRTFARAP